MEAMAMAGIDYTECGMDTNEFEKEDYYDPPPHLLVVEEEAMKKNNSDKNSLNTSNYDNQEQEEDGELHHKFDGQRSFREPSISF